MWFCPYQELENSTKHIFENGWLMAKQYQKIIKTLQQLYRWPLNAVSFLLLDEFKLRLTNCSQRPGTRDPASCSIYSLHLKSLSMFMMGPEIIKGLFLWGRYSTGCRDSWCDGHRFKRGPCGFQKESVNHLKLCAEAFWGGKCLLFSSDSKNGKWPDIEIWTSDLVEENANRELEKCHDYSKVSIW